MDVVFGWRFVQLSSSKLFLVLWASLDLFSHWFYYCGGWFGRLIYMSIVELYLLIIFVSVSDVNIYSKWPKATSIMCATAIWARLLNEKLRIKFSSNQEATDEDFYNVARLSLPNWRLEEFVSIVWVVFVFENHWCSIQESSQAAFRNLIKSGSELPWNRWRSTAGRLKSSIFSHQAHH